jgi:prefoldin subunit 5
LRSASESRVKLSRSFAERAENMREKKPPYDDRLAQIIDQLALITQEIRRLADELAKVAAAAHGPYGGSK